MLLPLPVSCLREAEIGRTLYLIGRSCLSLMPLCDSCPKLILSFFFFHRDKYGIYWVNVLDKRPTFCLFQFSSVAQSCLTLYDSMNHSSPGLPVHHQLPEFTQTQVHQVGDAIQPSHPLLSRSPPAPNPSQLQGLFQWVNSLHEVAKLLEFQLQHQSFQ